MSHLSHRLSKHVSSSVRERVLKAAFALFGEIWPTLVKICYFHKDKREFPQTKVQNKKVKRRSTVAGESGGIKIG